MLSRNWMMKAAWPLSWADLPPELLGLVLKRLHSLVDRVRLRAVCHPWRTNARLQSLPPPLPWLTLLDGTFLSIPDGKIIRMPVPNGAGCCGAIDNWLFLMQSDGGCSLMNPLSKAMLELPKLDTVWRRDWFNARDSFNPLFYKLVAPSPLDVSPDSLVAVLIHDTGNSCTVCICKPPSATDLSKGRYGDPLYYLEDIEFFDGKLYGTCGQKLVILEIADFLGSKPKISSVEYIIDSTEPLSTMPEHLPEYKGSMIRNYLVKSDGRLLSVTRFFDNLAHTCPTGPDFFEGDHTVAFVVLEADLSINPGRWRKVNKLKGQALFVGNHCSKSFPAGEYNGIQEDSIYFMCDYFWPDCPANPLRDSGVYNLRNGTIKPLLSETATVPVHHGGQWRPTWIFPADST